MSNANLKSPSVQANDWVGVLLEQRIRLAHKAGEGMLNGSAVHEIRKLLYAQDVPTAAFIDDHVANAIVQRNRARSERDSLREINRELVEALEECVTHIRNHSGFAPCLDKAKAALSRGSDE